MDFIELQEILLEDKPSKKLRKRKKELAELIPEFEKTYDFDQQTIWHKHDVFEHTLSVVDEVRPDARLRLAALFHDIGKPEVMTVDEEGQGHFYGHWVGSEEIFKKYQDEFLLNEEDIYLIRKLIFYHDLSIKNESLHVFIEEFDDEGLDLLYDLKRSDSMDHSSQFVPERLKRLEAGIKSIQAEKKRLGIKKEEREVEDEKVFLLAMLCNNTDLFVFKTRNYGSSEFVVGLNTLGGIVTYPVPMKYWGYFDIVEVDNINELNISSNEEKIVKLKSMFNRNRG